MKAVTQYIDPYPIKVKCAFCSKELVRNRYYLRKHPVSFCSQPCQTFYTDPKQTRIMHLINNDNFYYLVGLICTDGYINYPGGSRTAKTYTCVIKLSKKDEDILLNIQKIFGGSITYETNTGGFSKTPTKIVCWRVINKKFIEFLKNIGLTNNKTYTINVTDWFNTLTEKQKAAFIRGCYDGDGSINIADHTTANVKGVTASICSASRPFIEMIKTYFTNTGGVLYERKKSQNNIATCSLYYFYLNSKAVLNLERIYEMDTNDDLFLERKYKKFLEIQNYYTSIFKPRLRKGVQPNTKSSKS